MKVKKIDEKIYFFVDYNIKIIDKEQFVKSLVNKIKKTNQGYAGWSNKEYLVQHLKHHIFGISKNEKAVCYKFNKKKIKKIINDSLGKCKKKIDCGQTSVFVFPTFSPFIKEKMGGVNGFTAWQNTFQIYLNPTVKNWEFKLREIVCHEFTHSVSRYYHKWGELLDSLIFEGLAEHFRESVVGGKIAPWASAVSQEECKEYFKSLKKRLNSTNREFNANVICGYKKYPLWLGYSLGYNIVKDFLKKNKDLSWKEIIQMEPKYILKLSGW